ncbi:MAG: GNAT family N-acetyltransferase [Chloroflexi bacterium AL-W]|nr:GNAT family N-acetyltransferase [Chloroflexi bacterium AL-N1]NOK70477.1 GNAT family N-acetyltransferase [Chloroflexi bacterium AL-N10]NOK78164.1 GNAT family N-acetyltransferase [Chloroflexi bacterium AL-N5]NOK85263.1 GNAT family N-acetyltransferase [Chloroflexi bacterium AL-W]NOK92028.1 GNAT family N-acetyltransferase [Chloroflexi bacterium AL-N15]
MTTITMRSYTNEDLHQLVEFINTCDVVDQLEEGITAEELQNEFDSPDFDPVRDMCIWNDEDGHISGLAQIWSRPQEGQQDGYLWFKVHPEARSGEIEARIIAWGEERMREIQQERGVPVILRSGTRDDRTERIALLERHGFTASRHFWRMARPLDEPIATPVFPEGFTLRHNRGEVDTEAWVAMFNESFIDHWNHHPLTVEMAIHHISEPHFKLEGDLIAIAPDGTFAAFCSCSINPEENARNGRNEGWIQVLGTRRGFRRIGLGRAILLSGLRWLHSEGLDTAVLGVDADSLTDATKLYESVGFRTRHTSVSFEKSI